MENDGVTMIIIIVIIIIIIIIIIIFITIDWIGGLSSVLVPDPLTRYM